MRTLICTIFFFMLITDMPVSAIKPLENHFDNGLIPKSSVEYDTILIRKNWYVPDHVKMQYGGLIGFMSVGAGYQITQRYEPTLYYGLLTQDFGGSSITVNTISIKNSWKLFRPGMLGEITPKAGFSVNLGFTNKTFHRLPAHYPNNYYFQNKIHVAPFWGGEWTHDLSSNGIFSAIGIYAEMSTLDNYVLELIRTKYVSFDKIWNLAFGITLYFD